MNDRLNGNNQSAATATRSPLRPNIVLIMADDQGWGDTSHNGLSCTQLSKVT